MSLQEELDDLTLFDKALCGRAVSEYRNPNAQSRADLHADYLNLFHSYTRLALHGGSLEALKRALFIHWYGQAEPPFISGIPDLPDDDVEALCSLACARIANRADDVEFRLMISWYVYFADWCFASPPELIPLVLDLGLPVPDSLRQLSLAQFEGRGRMGDYWHSYLGGRDKRPH